MRRRAEVLDLGVDIVGDHVGVPVDAQRIAQLGIGLDLEAVIVGVALEILIDRQIVLDLPGRRLEAEPEKGATFYFSLKRYDK